jgi:hypothetical protein
VNYVLSPEHNPQIIARELLLGDTPKEFAAEFGRIRRQRRDIEKPVHHIALSLAREDRRLSADELEQIAHRYLEGIGYKGCQYLVVEHRETPHQHIHIIANRVRFDGTVVPYQYRDWEKAMAVVREIERDHGLRVVERDGSRGLKQPTGKEIRLALAHDEVSDRLVLQQMVRNAWSGQPSLKEFVGRLEERQVRVRFYRDQTGEVSGISYGFKKHDFGGYALGPSYTWNGIRREGVTYDSHRDSSAVEQHGGGLRGTWANRNKAAGREAAHRLRLVVQGAIAGHPTFPEFARRLESLGVRVELNVAKTGYVSGIRYHHAGRAYKGSELGRGFSWRGIQQQGVNYDPERDGAAVVGAGSRVVPDPPNPNPTREDQDDEITRARALIAGAVVDRPTLTDFVHRLEAAGIRVNLHQEPRGHVVSIGYRFGDTSVPARDLGPEFSWDEMRRWHIRYVDADDDVVSRLSTTLPHRKTAAGESAADSGFEGRHHHAAELRAVAQIVRSACVDQPPFSEFLRRVGEQGVRVDILVNSEYRPFSVSYTYKTRSISGSELGPGHSWHRLQQRVSLESGRDLDALAGVATVGEQWRREPRRLTPEQVAQVRLIVEGALADRPTLTEFVSRVEGAGVEVRLTTDREGRPLAISYGQGAGSVPGAELGPGHSWQRLEREALRFDPKRDREAFARVPVVQDREERPRTPRQPSAQQLAEVRTILDRAAHKRPTLTEFVRRAEKNGVEVRLYEDQAGRVSGVGYAVGGRPVPARDLGPGYVWSDLKRVGVVYHAVRDQRAVRVRSTTLARPNSALRELSHAYGAARTAVAWVQQPHVQALRLGARLLGRVATTLVKEVAYSATRARELRETSRGPIPPLRSVPIGAPRPFGAEQPRPRPGSHPAVTSLSRLAMAWAERSGAQLDKRGMDALAGLRRQTPQVAQTPAKAPPRVAGPDR